MFSLQARSTNIGEHNRSYLKSMRILLTGASGFIGTHLAAALVAAGHDVVACVRAPQRAGRCMPGIVAIAADFGRDHDVAVWLPRLAGIDCVINAVGSIRESPSQSFEALHARAPKALFAACAQAGVGRIIQISALGADDAASTPYHLSKKAADDFLRGLDPEWVIIQPSLVYGRGGASAQLFNTLAAAPVIPLIGDGEQRVQPVYIDDLVSLVVRCVSAPDVVRQTIAAVGPAATSLRAWLVALRHGMRLPRTINLAIPMTLMRLVAKIGDHMPHAPLTRDTLSMLERGNTADANVIARILGRPPRAIDQFIPCEQARAIATEARLAIGLPLLRLSIAVLWLASGIVSLGLYPVDASYALLEKTGVRGAFAPAALYGAAALDIVFGVLILMGKTPRWIWLLQLVLIAGYSAIIAWFLPEFWLHPYAPMVKNIPIAAAIFLLLLLQPIHTK